MPMTGEDASQEVSLYFHIPFCSKKCPYCHFFVLPNQDRFKLPFLEALKQEWALRLPQLQGKTIRSLYFGGGTPSKLSPAQYFSLFHILHASNLTFSPSCEITLEANPEDVTPELACQWHSLGVNRVSIGVQSLVDSELLLLERTHSAQRAKEALNILYQAGITNLSLDLLFELPSQTLHSFRTTLDALHDLPLTHLSLYNLVFEPHTVFFKNRDALLPHLPSDQEGLALWQLALDALDALGLQRYELSAFAHPGRESVHNTGYWTGRPFLGFGPSAFSYWEGSRFSNTTRFHSYLSLLNQGTLPVSFQETLPYPRNLQELLVIQLRLTQGLSLPHFLSKHGPLPPFLEEQLQALIHKGWLEKTSQQILRLTPQGLLFYDTVASELI